MKKTITLMFIASLMLAIPANAQVLPTGGEAQSDTSGISYGAVVGAVTVNGKNYQQFGLRTDVPLGKFGFGVDIQLLLDDQGNIYKEDWDEWTDYLDKIYYIRYGRKGQPFYIRTGGLNYTTLGYGNIIDGYSNMVEYPSVKRYGMEMAVNTDFLEVELIINNFKELGTEDPGMLMGTRFAVKPIGKLEIGVSFAADFNEYNGLKDADGDGFPDQIDLYNDNENWAVDYDKFESEWLADNPGLLPTDPDFVQFVSAAEKYKLLDPTRQGDLFNKNKAAPSISMIYSADIGYPIVETDNFGLDIYSQITQIQGHGWGFALPGIKMTAGKFFTFTAEYRKQSRQFMYGYYNATYEFERAVFIDVDETEGTDYKVLTKRNRLYDFNDAMNGYLAGVKIDLAGMAFIDFRYSDMIGVQDAEGNFEHTRTLRGELSIKEGLIPKISTAKGYYLQNNVADFTQWMTPQTTMGFLMETDMSGMKIGFDYRWNFVDGNGNGTIDKAGTLGMNDKTEILKSISVITKISF